MASKQSLVIVGFLLLALAVLARSDDEFVLCDFVGDCKDNAECPNKCMDAGYYPDNAFCIIIDPFAGSNLSRACCCLKHDFSFASQEH